MEIRRYQEIYESLRELADIANKTGTNLEEKLRFKKLSKNLNLIRSDLIKLHFELEDLLK